MFCIKYLLFTFIPLCHMTQPLYLKIFVINICYCWIFTCFKRLVLPSKFGKSQTYVLTDCIMKDRVVGLISDFFACRWYHQVTSSGVRHLAINLWFAHVYWFDSSNCSIDQDYYKLIEPITKFGFASPNESYRWVTTCTVKCCVSTNRWVLSLSESIN